ncbi:MAG: porin family protein [Candidatus Moranbacteria bacterium]|nr:porin family protein [Candidatus Moranbacteria bacterium]
MKTKMLFALFVLVFLSVNSFAQEKEKPFGIEVNGDVSIVSSEFSGSSTNTGLGFEAILQYRFLPFTSVYGGWGFMHFNAKESFAGPDVDFEQTGYVFGLQFRVPINKSPVSYFARAGLLFSHIEIENKKGEIIGDTGHGLGWQAATGIEVSMGGKLSLVSGLRYNYLSRDAEIGSENFKLDIRFVSARIGLIKRF